MGIKYYRKGNKLLGGYENVDPPAGAIEVDEKDLPESALMEFKGGNWVDTPASIAAKTAINPTAGEIWEALKRKFPQLSDADLKP